VALKTGGTNANTSLSAVKFLPGYGSGVSASDVAAFNADVKDDQNVAHPQIPGSFDMSVSRLYIPNRGVLQLLPGDWLMVDATTGWPILLSSYAIASGPWHHS
jgi:hypothetical protein